jgi:hypothetical protein
LDAKQVLTLYYWNSASWDDLGDYDVIKARLARLKQEIEVHDNLLTAGLVTSASGNPYAVTVTRGLTVAGTAYTVTTRMYFISKAVYDTRTGATLIVADLIPNLAIRSVAADDQAQTVLAAALAYVQVTDYIVEASRDVWYDWQFYPATKTLNLYDARTLSSVIANKYFAYFFPRSDGLHAYNAPSNATNNEEGHYTPFTHARIKTLVSADKYLNLSWTNEVPAKEYMIRDASYAFHSCGYIASTDAPLGHAKFTDWGQVFTKQHYEIEQRPDLRLEHGDLVQLSIDSFDRTRCIELEEVFKRGKDPMWKQTIKQLPWHPQAGAASIGDFPDDPTPKPSAASILTVTDNFLQLLTAADVNVQEALETIAGQHGEWTDWVPTLTCSGALTFTTLTIHFARYKVDHKRVFFQFKIQGTTGGTANTTIYATTPIDPLDFTATLPCTDQVYDGALTNAQASIDTTNHRIAITKYLTDAPANFGLGAGRIIYAVGWYEIA